MPADPDPPAARDKGGEQDHDHGAGAYRGTDRRALLIAAGLTLWSMFVYVRAAWPNLTEEQEDS